MGWKWRWGYEVADKPSATGIWKLKTGGYLVVARVRDRRRGGRRTKQRALHGASLPHAKSELALLREEARALAGGRIRRRMLWSEYAASLFERKVASRELGSPKSIERWDTTLRLHLIPAFGAFWCDELRFSDIEDWKLDVIKKHIHLEPRIPHPDEKKARAGLTVRNPDFYAPSTANGWLSILGVICERMAAELELPKAPTAGVKTFDTTLHRTYTHEKPNALTPDWAAKFMAAMKERWPEHYPMTLLGFVTGLRPSSMRALRRKGPEADIKWETGRLLVRRSNAKDQIVVDRTKTGADLVIDLPADVVAVLKEHAESLPDGPMEESELLFPARHGGHRTRSVLDKPFRDVAKAIGLPFHVTPRAMRRTNKDLLRAAAVPDVVAKAISGHATDAMHERYSTAASEEKREAVGAVAEILGGAPKRDGKRAGRKSRNDS